jgi:hypothetical protein
MKAKLLTLATALLLSAANVAVAEINLWPVPEGEPVSAFWSVDINGRRADALMARTADPPFDHYDYGGEYAFLSVDADEPLEFTIKEETGANLDNLVIRPQSLGLKPTMNDDGTFSIAVDKPCQFSVEYDGRLHPLLIFVNPLETDVPNEGDDNVIYYGPGVHKADKIAVGDNQTLYLAPGAVVQGGIYVNGKNVKIRGRGVLDSNPWKWREGPTGHTVHVANSQDVSIEGIIVRGSSRWTVVPVNSDNVVIDNIKICGGRAQNDDGINPCNSRNVHVSNTFIRSDDDCIALKGLEVDYGNCEDISAVNCVFWCDRARIVLMGHESRAPYMRRVLFKNCDVIHSQTRNFLLEPGEKMRMEDITFEDIRFETGKENALSPEALEKMKSIDTSTLRFDVDVANKDNWLFVGRPVVNVYMRTKEPGYIKNVVIRNVSVTGPASYCGILFSGADEEHRTDGLTIENFVLFGEKQTSDSPLIHIGDFIDNVEVK